MIAIALEFFSFRVIGFGTYHIKDVRLKRYRPESRGVDVVNKQTQVVVLTRPKFKSGRKSDQSHTKIVKDRRGKN